MRVARILQMVLAAVMLACGRASAAEVPFMATTATQQVSPVIDIAAGDASPSDVLAGRVVFTPTNVNSLAGSPVRAWLRLSLPPLPHDRPDVWLTLRTAEYAELYETDAAGTVREQVTGNALALSRRSNTSGWPAFALQPDRVGTRPLYIHVQFHQEYPLVLSLQSTEAFYDARLLNRLVSALFLGGLLAVVIFNLYVFFVLRDRPAIFFVVYALALALNELVTTGIGAHYLWPDFSTDPRLAVLVTSSLGFISFLLFARAFLFTRQSVPWLDRALIAILCAEVGIAVVQYALPTGRALVFPLLGAELLGGMMMAFTAFARWKQGFQPARYFAIAFVPAIVGVFANLAYNAFLPHGNWFFAAYGVEFGTLLEAMIISCGVVDRFRVLEGERRTAQEALVRESMQNVQLRRLVATDALTNLANRIAFSDGLAAAVAAAQRSGHLLIVLYVDLDGFKGINDRYGHRAGDEVLKAVANWLTSSVRTADLVARIGGDEFAIILPEVSNEMQIERLVEAVRRSVERSLVFEGHRLDVHASVGYATFPRDGSTLDGLLDAADRAMYVEKERHRAQALPPSKS